ncbi:darcynin family protein [Streptomyces sp. P1-3]|uniref:darcynin family protein n=1 Tax=Streptomyces sp. P1-3 TaxID=3421658 RepID=UPI003D36081E
MDEALGTETAWTVFMHLTVTPAWLALTRAERDAALAEHVAPLLARHAPVSMLEWYDADAFSASPTDVAVVRTTDLEDWNRLLEGLRDSPLLAVPYYRLDRVIVTRAGGFAERVAA